MQQWPQNNHKKYLTSGIHLVISKIATMSKEATLVMDHSNSSIGILHYASVWYVLMLTYMHEGLKKSLHAIVGSG